MDTDTDARPAAPPSAAPTLPTPRTSPDRLGAEVRESAVLLVLSMAVTVGLASGVQALLAVLG